MIKQARENVKLRLAGLDLSSRVEFVQASAEALPVEQGSVDFIVAGAFVRSVTATNQFTFSSS